MEHILKLEVPEDLYSSLVQRASETGSTPERVVLGWLTREFSPPKAKTGRDAGDDALMALAGTLHSEIEDVAERHDYYIGQELMRDHRPKDDG